MSVRAKFWRLGASFALAAVGLFAPRVALAQACCVAPGAAGVSRLAAYETAAMGIDARGHAQTGSFDDEGTFRPSPPRTREVLLEQDVFGTLRLLKRAQVSVTVPFVQTLRSVETTSSVGGGLGDVRLGGRWDIVYADDAWPWPGLAVTGGVSLPTGTAPERATDALGADATGAGTTQGWAGLTAEQISGPWYGNVGAMVTMRADRSVGALRVSLPPRLTMSCVGARVWRSGAALSFGTSWEFEDRASVSGVVVPGSARRALRLTAAFQLRIGESKRIVTSIYAVPPIPVLTAGDFATLGLSFALVHHWS